MVCNSIASQKAGLEAREGDHSDHDIFMWEFQDNHYYLVFTHLQNHLLQWIQKRRRREENDEEENTQEEREEDDAIHDANEEEEKSGAQLSDVYPSFVAWS